jgi:hypothetical protein
MDANNSAVLSFGQEHFAQADFGDQRLTRRAVMTADQILKHPGGTLPEKLNGEAELDGLYRLANNPKVTHEKMLEAHVAHTRQMMGDCSGVVLVIHDTTELDFSGLSSVTDFGPIGNGGCRGLLCHNSLAVDYQNREVLGLIGQTLQARRKVPKGEKLTAKREHPQRESRLWLRGVEAVGPVAEGKRWVNLWDRGGDTFESLERQQTLGQWYCGRSKSNRTVEVMDGQGRTVRRKLHGWMRKLASLGERKVEVSGNHKQVERKAVVRVAAGEVKVLAPRPKRGEHGNEPLAMWAVHVREVNPPRGQEPLEWILLTNVRTGTLAEACERIDWYECRPVIEEYHKAQKTGCGIEEPQFTTRKAMEVVIALLSVVATRLLRLRDLSRRSDAEVRPATEVVDEEYVRVLSVWRFKRERVDLSVKEFLYALAKLGGHLGRKHDKAPGWLVLWRGWTKLQLYVEGAAVGRKLRCEET